MHTHEDIPTPLLREAIQQVRTLHPISDEQEQVLLWLVWLSLASVEDLARCLRKDKKTVWNYLDQLEEHDLLAHVLMSEPGWPRRHHRYYITDLGLYVLVARQPEPISVSELVQSYPVTRTDLLARLASPVIHLTLSTLISRLLAQCPAQYQLTSYQQPWRERYKSLDGKGHIFSCDAAFLLRTPAGDQHACYVRVDQQERLFSTKAERHFLAHLFAVRQASALQGNPLPSLLILSAPARFSFWSKLLDEFPILYATKPLHGAIVDTSQLEKGVYGPIWVPFDYLPHLIAMSQQWDQAHVVPLYAILDIPATPALVEQFSQYFTFRHVHARRTGGLLARKPRHLPRYVGDSLQQAVACFSTQPHSVRVTQIASAFHEKQEARREMAARLSLMLSNQQKEILALLVRHPYLSEEDLLTLLHPASTDIRLVRRQLEPLIDLQLVQRFLWHNAPNVRDYRRHHLTEQGMRYLSTRQQLSPTYYLFPVTEEEPQDRHTISPLEDSIQWTQRGATLLRDQLPHTNGLYRCVRRVFAVAHQSDAYAIICWKSAREAVRWHRDSLTSKIAYARPDAELLYHLPGAILPRSLLIEYDRGTTFYREYAAKFEAYVDYQDATNSVLPPILIILQRSQSVRALDQAIREVGADCLQVVMVLAWDVERLGLLPALRQLHPDSPNRSVTACGLWRV